MTSVSPVYLKVVPHLNVTLIESRTRSHHIEEARSEQELGKSRKVSCVRRTVAKRYREVTHSLLEVSNAPLA